MGQTPGGLWQTGGATVTVVVLAVSSPGGHAVQLRLVMRELKKMGVHDITHVTAEAQRKTGNRYFLRDCSLRNPVSALVCLAQSISLVYRLRPDVLVTTGAAPGAMLIVASRLFGVQQRIWIDSLANSRQLSLSGRFARRWCTAVYTQWPDLQDDRLGVRYLGSVL